MMIYVYKILLFYTCNILNFLLLYGNVKISRFKSAYFDIIVCFQRGSFILVDWKNIYALLLYSRCTNEILFVVRRRHIFEF